MLFVTKKVRPVVSPQDTLSPVIEPLLNFLVIEPLWKTLCKKANLKLNALARISCQ